MGRCLQFGLKIVALSTSVFVASCISQSHGNDVAFSPIGHCEVYEGQGESTDYTVELGIGATDEIVLGIQGVHRGQTRPLQITAIVLSNGERLKPELLSNDCTCGVKFRRMDAMCAFLSTYRVNLRRGWLEDARDTGLSMQLELANGLVSEGPPLKPEQIATFLSRLDE